MSRLLYWQEQRLLECKQEEMRYRTELEREKPEFEELTSRTDLKCPYCTRAFTKVSARTGELLPCKKCKIRRVTLYKYKLSLRQFGNWLREQNYRCAICNTEFDYATRTTIPNVDHCHDLEHNRGILCGACNLALGGFRDDITLLERAIRYLRLNKVERKWWFQKYYK